jgi:hypothetical protein
MKRLDTSRRGFMQAIAFLPFAFAAKAAEKPKPHDHGIGGTGAYLRGGDDQGIGGTGIVGTITGFGSIIVNGVRVPYATGVPVYMDGRPTSADKMRLGHVVRVLLDGTQAQSIHVTSEVIGPVTEINNTRIGVLSQSVDITTLADRPRFRRGQMVAVYGIRKPDGTIVASRIEGRPASIAPILRGIATRQDGDLAISGFGIGRPTAGLVGRRVVVTFLKSGGTWRPGKVKADDIVPGMTHGTVNIETFVERNGSTMRTGLGFRLNDNRLQPFGRGGRALLNVPVAGGHLDPGPGGFGRPDDRPRFNRSGPGGPPGGFDRPDPGAWGGQNMPDMPPPGGPRRAPPGRPPPPGPPPR